MKRIIFITSLAAIFNVNSGHSESSSGWCPYIGLGEGWSQINSAIEVTADTKQTFRDQYSSLFSTFFFGTEKKITENHFVGGKIFLRQNWLNNENTAHNVINGIAPNQKFDFQERHTVGISAELGTHITDKTKIYGGLEAVYTSFTFAFTNSLVSLGGPITRSLFGMGPKIGFRTSLTSHLDFYLEGAYLFYGRWNSTIMDIPQAIQIKRSISPQTLHASAGVVYSF